MTTVEEISSLLVSLASGRPAIYGSDLGFAIRKQFPDIDLKTQYGGLYRFIRQYCSNDIVLIGKRGADNVYAHRSVSSADSAPLHADSKTIWRAFSNPKNNLRLILNKNAAQLGVVNSEETDLTDDQILVEKMSSAEYRLICLEFLNQVKDEAVKADLREALEHEDFWPYWSRTVNINRVKGVYSDWLKFRHQRVLEILRTRLDALELADEAIQRAMGPLRHARQTQSARRPHESDSRLPRLTASNLRTVIQEAISTLPEEDLRRIWLPVGVLLDALKSNRQR